MIWLLYIVSGLFVVFSFFIFVEYEATKLKGLLCGAMAYGIGGSSALLSGSWWPLAIGFAVASILRLFGADKLADNEITE